MLWGGHRRRSVFFLTLIAVTFSPIFILKFKSSISELRIFLNDRLRIVSSFIQLFWFVKWMWLLLARLRLFAIRPSWRHFSKNFICCVERYLDLLILFHCLKAQWLWYPNWVSMRSNKIVFASLLRNDVYWCCGSVFSMLWRGHRRRTFFYNLNFFLQRSDRILSSKYATVRTIDEAPWIKWLVVVCSKSNARTTVNATDLNLQSSILMICPIQILTPHG